MKFQKFSSSHKQNDRVYVDGKQVSVTRVYLTEALQLQGREGATKAELLTLTGKDIGGDSPARAIGQSIRSMLEDGEIVERDDRYWLKECAPQEQGGGPAPYATNGQRAQVSPTGGNGKVAPFAAKRTGKTISVYTSPRVFEDAIALSLFIEGRWFKIPLAGSARVCYGNEAPMWSPDQEMYGDVEIIKVHLRNGQMHEERPARADIVTVLLEE